jgi:hypothetical protein
MCDKRVTIFGFSYDIGNDTILLFENYPEMNILQLSKSTNSSWVIYSKVVDNGSIDLFKMYKDDGLPQRITNTDGIEFDPYIDDYGNTAWVYHSYSVSESEIFINGIKISSPVSLYKYPILFDNIVVVNSVRFEEDTLQLILIDIPTNAWNILVSPLVVDQVTKIDESTLLFEGMEVATGKMAVYSFDMEKQQFIKLHDNAVIINDKVLYLNSSQERSLKILAERDLYLSDPLASLSAGNNYLGRLSWCSSYRLLGLLNAYNIGGISDNMDSTLIKKIIQNSVSKIVNSVSNGLPTKKYSIDHSTELSLLVDDATILYPLLKIYNSKIIDDNNIADKIISTAIKIYNDNESEFIESDNGYIFRKGIWFIMDGAQLPFNQQNAFGLALIELYIATGDDKYKQRALGFVQI